MASLSTKNREFFKSEGRKGGLKRARRLTATQRSEIASQAARARWCKKSTETTELRTSFRFENPKLTHPVYLEEVLLYGTVDAWRQIYQKISDQPFGEIASALERFLMNTDYYGVTPLWRGLLARLRGAVL